MLVAFSINEDRVIYEVIDGETIMISLNQGNYYTLNDTGSWVWQLMRQKRSLTEILSLMQSNFGITEADAQAHLKPFVAALRVEKLIQPVPLSEAVTAPLPDYTGGEYLPPEVTVFNDMQELLLLDPIHETSDEGWPYTLEESLQQDTKRDS